MSEQALEKLRREYLDVMEASLTGVVYRDASRAPFGSNTFDLALREHGLDWPAHALTMIGSKRMANLRVLVEAILADRVPGDFIETGVWRGGACIMMRAVLHAYGITDRRVWVADSFAGLPPPNEADYPADAGSDFHVYEQLAISLEDVQENFASFGLLDGQVVFLKGWFKDTLPAAPIERLALLRLDGDMYESTMDALVNLYPRLSANGYVIVDDYHVVPACKVAVHDYCTSMGISPDLVEIDGVGVYWRKSAEALDLPEEIEKTTSTPTEAQVGILKQSLIDISTKLVGELSKLLGDRDAKIQTLDTRLIEAEASAEVLHRTLGEFRDSVDTLKQSLSDQDSAMEALKLRLLDREAAIDGLKLDVADRETAIDGLKLDVAERETAIDGLTLDVAERETAIDGLKRDVADRETAIDGLTRLVAARNHAIDELHASTSWRITKPLRILKGLFVREADRN